MNPKRQRIISGKMPRAFGTEPILRKNTKKALVTPKQLEKLIDSLLKAVEQDPDEEHRNLLISEITHRYNVWLEKSLAQHKAKDFLIDEDVKLAPSTIVDSN